ncbi:MAG: glycosyltransferase family 1 protein, partial [Nitrososphaeria archaeon]
MSKGHFSKLTEIMRVLIVNNRVPASGIGRYALQLSLSLVNNGNIHVDCFNWEGGLCEGLFQKALQLNNVALLYAEEALRILSQLIFVFRIPKGYPLYHIVSPALAFVSLIRRPSIITVHDLIPFIGPRSITDFVIQKSMYFIKSADHIICVSESTKNDLLRFINVDPRKLRIVYYGVDHDLFKPRDKLEARKRLRLPLDKPIILNVGSEEPRKNIPTLLKAFKVLVNDVPDALLVRVGERTASMKSLINALGLQSKVMYRKASPNEVALYYNAADLLAYPSYYEGFGNPPLEAMSSGLPVIAGNRTSIPEVVGDAGILL